jgi:hypothetical protein
MQFTPVDRTGPLGQDVAREAARDVAFTEFCHRWRRLPTFARNYSFHAASVRAPGNPPLARTLRRLQGKFVVVNPSLDVRLPAAIAARGRGVLRQLGDPADGRASWLAAALYEPSSVTIHHRWRAGVRAADMGRQVQFLADVPYRLVLFAGRGEPADAAALPASGLPAGRDPARLLAEPWFTLALYTPDEDALRQMPPDTALVYKRVTGRLGPAARESYWHLEAWERFHERGRLAGHVAPDVVGHERLGGAAEAWRSRTSVEAPEDNLFSGAGGYAASRWNDLTPGFDQRSFVPPGYCLVEYRCRVDLEVVVAGG